jgi:hypothetical protein
MTEARLMSIVDLRFQKLILTLVGHAKHKRGNAMPVRDHGEAAEAHTCSRTGEFGERESDNEGKPGQAAQHQK